MSTPTIKQSILNLNYCYVVDLDKVVDKTLAVRDDFCLQVNYAAKKTRQISKAAIIVMATMVVAYSIITDIGIVLSSFK